MSLFLDRFGLLLARRTAFAIALLGCGLVFGGCTSVEPARRSAQTGEPAIPEKDRVLFDDRQGVAALRQGHDGVAKAKLDDAIARIGGIITNSEDAKKARSLFSTESTKVFIGEPYERVMAYYYRGILYWRDGEPDNARACFRTGQVIDSDAVEGKYKADYVLLDYLDALATAKLGGDGSDALKRAETHVTDGFALPPLDPANNLLVFAEFGRGPRKFAAGEYGEQLKFATKDSRAHSARLVLDGAVTVPLSALDDLNFQATTRGGRVMDHILGNKAVFKATTDTAGDLALAGAVIAHNEAQMREWQGQDGHGADMAALGLGVIGLISKVASAATKPKADTRQWDNLPQRLSFNALKLAPGEYHGTVEFLDGDGQVIVTETQPVTINVVPDRDTVVFLSELKR